MLGPQYQNGLLLSAIEGISFSSDLLIAIEVGDGLRNEGVGRAVRITDAPNSDCNWRSVIQLTVNALRVRVIIYDDILYFLFLHFFSPSNSSCFSTTPAHRKH
jgi:hypothetical protein